MRIGINSDCECGNATVETFKKFKDAGFTDVMVAAKFGSLAEAIKNARAVGLGIPFVHLSYKNLNDLWAKGEFCLEVIENTCAEIEICGRNNIPIAVMHVNCGKGTNIALAPSRHAIDNMNKILEVAKENNVKIAVENLTGETSGHYKYLLDNIDSQWLGLCYDCGHHHLYETDFPLVEKYSDRIIAVHIHDNMMDWEPGWDVTKDVHYLPGDGKIDFEEVFSQLAKTNYDGCIVFELHRNIGRKGPSNNKYSHLTVEKFLQRAFVVCSKLLAGNKGNGYTRRQT